MVRPSSGLPRAALPVVVAALLLACASGPDQDARQAEHRLDQEFTREQLLEDVASLFATVEAIHPDPFHRFDADAAARARRELEKGLEDGMGRMDLWRRAAPVVALFRDGHTRLPSPQEEWSRVWASGGAVFPLVLTFDPDGAVVRSDLSDEQGIPPGTPVLEINGRPIDEVAREITATLAYERETLRLFALNGSQTSLIWAVHGWEGPFVLELELPSGERVTRTLEGIDSLEWKTRADAAGLRPPPTDPFSFTTLAGGSLGYLDLRTFSDVDGLRPFLETSFRTLRDAPPCALVIDLRRNGGGSSDPGDWILGYLTDRPVRQFSRVDVRASAALKRATRDGIPWPLRALPARVMGVFDDRAGSLLGSPDGALITWIEQEEGPGSNPLRWNGPVFALVGVRTFSSGADLAAALQDYGLATLVGEETGGLASAFGDFHTATLPHTGLRLDVSTKFFVRPSGVADGRGVVPDVEVPMDPGAAPPDDPAIQRILDQLDTRCAAVPEGE